MNRWLLRGIGAWLALVGSAAYADSTPSASAIREQGQAAVASAERLAEVVQARVDAAAREQRSRNVSALPRARAFYDVVMAERVEWATRGGFTSDETLPTVRIAGQDAALLARPGGSMVTRLESGSRGVVLERNGGWVKLLADNGAIGWVVSSNVVEEEMLAPSRPTVTAYYARLASAISYPRNSSTAAAIARMARGAVSAIPNRCAGSMAEALGWGLGDAHEWASGLPKRGFVRRQSGAAPQPGDIVVWPFTFGPNRRQHVGFAVAQEGKVKLLSNLNGRIRLSAILPGYVAFAPPR